MVNTFYDLFRHICISPDSHMKLNIYLGKRLTKRLKSTKDDVTKTWTKQSAFVHNDQEYMDLIALNSLFNIKAQLVTIWEPEPVIHIPGSLKCQTSRFSFSSGFNSASRWITQGIKRIKTNVSPVSNGRNSKRYCTFEMTSGNWLAGTWLVFFYGPF